MSGDKSIFTAGERSKSGGRLARFIEETLAESLLSIGSGLKVFVGVAVSTDNGDSISSSWVELRGVLSRAKSAREVHV